MKQDIPNSVLIDMLLGPEDSGIPILCHKALADTVLPLPRMAQVFTATAWKDMLEDRLEATETVPFVEKLVYGILVSHSFIWFVMDCNPDNGLCFGYVMNVHDDSLSEAGDFSLFELIDCNDSFMRKALQKGVNPSLTTFPHWVTVPMTFENAWTSIQSLMTKSKRKYQLRPWMYET